MTTVAQALAAVMNDVREVRKKERNAQQGFNFRGVDAVMNAVGPALRAHGVICVPEVIDHTIAGKTTAKGAQMNFVTVRVRYTFHGPDGDTLSGEVAAESFDSGDKATAKAMSVAYRTFLLQALCLPTDDPDPDQDTYQEARPAQQQGPPPRDWPKEYEAAKSMGPGPLRKFLDHAKTAGGPAGMIQAGEKHLAEHTPIEGDVIA